MSVRPDLWPWHVLSGWLLLVAVWKTAQSARAPGEVVVRPWRSQVLVTLLSAAWWTLLSHNGGPRVIPDTVRDLVHAFGIARLGIRPAEGPAIPSLQASLSPAWYYLLSLPMLSDHPGAVQVALIAMQALTVGVLFGILWRLSGRLAAWIGSALFLLSSAAASNYQILTHSNLVFLLTALVVDALIRLHVDGRSHHVVWLFLWLSLAVQVHLSAIVLVPFVLCFAALWGRDADWSDTLVAVGAGLAPVLLTMPSLPGARASSVAAFLSEHLSEDNLLFPSAVAACVVARPRTMLRRAPLLGSVGALGVWAWLILPLAPGASLRWFNLHTLPVGGQMPFALPEGVAGSTWRSVWTFGERWLFGDPVGTAQGVSVGVAYALAALGAVSYARAATDRGHPAARRAEATLALVWLALTVTGGLALVKGAGEYARYMSVGAVAVIAVVAHGASVWWRVARGGDGVRGWSAWLRDLTGCVLGAVVYTVWPTVMVGAAVAPLVARVAPSRARGPAVIAWGAFLVGRVWPSWVPGAVLPDMTRLEVAEELVDEVLDLPGVGLEGLRHRVHAYPDLIDSQRTALLPFALLRAAREGGPAAQDGDGRHWRVVERAEADTDHEAVPLGSTGFVAVPYLPAVRMEAAALSRPVRRADGPQITRAELPLRSEVPTVAPAWTWSLLGLDPGAWAPGDDGVVADLSLPRDVPADARLDAVVVLANFGLGGGAWGPPRHCVVDVSVDGDALTAASTDGTRWTYRLGRTAAPVTLRVVVRDCYLRVLDIYDAPMAPDITPPAR